MAEKAECPNFVTDNFICIFFSFISDTNFALMIVSDFGWTFIWFSWALQSVLYIFCFVIIFRQHVLKWGVFTLCFHVLKYLNFFCQIEAHTSRLLLIPFDLSVFAIRKFSACVYCCNLRPEEFYWPVYACWHIQSWYSTQILFHFFFLENCIYKTPFSI